MMNHDSDVGSSYPGAGEGPKGLAVRQLKGHASWVQTVVNWITSVIKFTTTLNPIKENIRNHISTFRFIKLKCTVFSSKTHALNRYVSIITSQQITAVCSRDTV